MASKSDVFFSENGFQVRINLSRLDQHAVHALRAQTFCQELRWVGTTADQTELDEFDDDAIHIGVFDPDGLVVGTTRLISHRHPWMFDEIFADLLPGDYRLQKEAGTMEASRLAVRPESRNLPVAQGRTVADLLYKAAFQVCALHGTRFLYMVVSHIVHRHLCRRGLPCEALGPATVMPDGVKAVPAVLDWGRMLYHSDQEQAGWFGSLRSTPCAWPWQSPAGDSPRLAS